MSDVDWSDSIKIDVRVAGAEELMASEVGSEDVYVDDDWYCGSVMRIVDGTEKFSQFSSYNHGDFDDWERIKIAKDGSQWVASVVKNGPTKFNYHGSTIDEATAHLLSTPRVDINPFDPS